MNSNFYQLQRSGRMWDKRNPNWWVYKLKSNTSAWMCVYPDGVYGIWDQAASLDPVCVANGVEQDMDQALIMVERVAANMGDKKA